MKPFFAAVVAVLLVSVGRAGPSERAILAAMKLSEQPNYSWSTTVADDARTYEVEGKTDRSGYTWMRLPMVKTIAQRLGRDAEPQVEAVFKGPAHYVIRTGRGWKTFKELPKPSWEWKDDFEFWPTPAHARGNISAAAMAGLDPNDVSPFPPPTIVLPPPSEAEERRPYSNAQFALSLPHDELSVIVSSHTALKSEGDIVTGTLSDLGAQLLLVREGQDHIQPLCAAGLFRLVIKNGMVTRYSLRLEGILFVDRKKIHVHQESSTQLTNIGTTAVQVADDIRRKLGPDHPTR
jgi:hypothetical protein